MNGNFISKYFYSIRYGNPCNGEDKCGEGSNGNFIFKYFYSSRYGNPCNGEDKCGEGSNGDTSRSVYGR